MMLGHIRDYLRQRGSASLSDVAVHFNIAPDTAKFALNYWQKKGKIREQASTCSSGGCGDSCSGGSSPVYEWVRRDIPLRWLPTRTSGQTK
ncbi:MAG: FeoC-like transcriptional regulator [Thiolinea sp.]